MGGAVMQLHCLVKVLPGPQNLGGADFWGAKRTALKIVLILPTSVYTQSKASSTDSQLSSWQERVCGVPLELPSVELCALWVI